MSGIKYLLDTNFILGLLKATPEVFKIISHHGVLTSNCAYSAITRMELMGYLGISAEEEKLIKDRLSNFCYLPITSEIEDMAIAFRRTRKMKLPDAIIAATAKHHDLELLSLDKSLVTILSNK
jgi:predicted nucleic acid-binding protein